MVPYPAGSLALDAVPILRPSVRWRRDWDSLHDGHSSCVGLAKLRHWPRLSLAAALRVACVNNVMLQKPQLGLEV